MKAVEEATEWAKANADWRDMTQDRPPRDHVLAFRDARTNEVWLGMNRTDGATAWAYLQ